MHIHIDYNSGEPIIHQVVAQIKLMVVSSKLLPGSRLPSIRGFSKDLKINPTTVTRIYKELEHQGIIVLRHGQGAFVVESQRKPAKKQAAKTIRPKVETLLVEGLRLGLTQQEIIEVLKQEYKKIKEVKK
jgi:GntR family transcriptional regulator